MISDWFVAYDFTNCILFILCRPTPCLPGVVIACICPYSVFNLRSYRFAPNSRRDTIILPSLLDTVQQLICWIVALLPEFVVFNYLRRFLFLLHFFSDKLLFLCLSWFMWLAASELSTICRRFIILKLHSHVVYSCLASCETYIHANVVAAYQ